MKITRKEEFIVLKDNKNNLVDFAERITENYSDYRNDNVIVDLLNYENFDIKDALLFLEISNIHRAEKKSFVIVNSNISIDVIPDELIVVPSLLEAGDIIKMEDLERELGF
ncbi:MULTISPECIES: hypothetical protein [Gillisia]|jgi:hypothetical protein|uniref:Ribonuclease Z n=1 Tax=Gillisia hiemivivida TaxID=291190 RepID=A0A5C6ZU39_9FLAO|nr:MULTISPECIES: hypothetical protein [Gillisia]TXD92302.1 ribonuclease Z [Gillisia hiemivivida]